MAASDLHEARFRPDRRRIGDFTVEITAALIIAFCLIYLR